VDWYLSDPRLVVVPLEHLSETGMRPALADVLVGARGWSRARVAVFDAAFARYWERSAALARRTPTWPAPRRRHVAVVAEAGAVRPYAQLLNTSAWTVWDADLDPERSDPELLAWLLVLGDRMAVTGEVATAPLHAAPWWFERTDAECAAFAAAAARATRPDADALRAVADALPWLRGLRHEALRPPVIVSPHRAVPGTGLLVPRALEAEPPALVARTAAVARRTLDGFRAAWRGPGRAAARALLDRLAAEAPRVLVTGDGGRILWDPAAPERREALAAALDGADDVAVRAVDADLAVVDRHTRAFLAALVDPDALPAPAPGTFQTGYSYLHAERRLVAYKLHEPGMERLAGPPLPFAREMLGARTAHEWAHLAEAAGWVPRTAGPERFTELLAAFAAQMDAVIAAAPTAVRARTAADTARLAAEGTHGSAGAALARIFLQRIPDWQANLVARRFMSAAEGEIYVRHNVRTLRPEYPPPALWRMLVRYLYEYQYLCPALGLAAVADPRAYLFHSTWFADDFLVTGVLDAARFDALAAAAGALCAAWAVDESRFRNGASSGRDSPQEYP
jgi:hypothetical protein